MLEVLPEDMEKRTLGTAESGAKYYSIDYFAAKMIGIFRR
jgi:hypothetical protein